MRRRVQHVNQLGQLTQLVCIFPGTTPDRSTRKPPAAGTPEGLFGTSSPSKPSFRGVQAFHNAGKSYFDSDQHRISKEPKCLSLSAKTQSPFAELSHHFAMIEHISIELFQVITLKYKKYQATSTKPTRILNTFATVSVEHSSSSP